MYFISKYCYIIFCNVKKKVYREVECITSHKKTLLYNIAIKIFYLLTTMFLMIMEFQINKLFLVKSLLSYARSFKSFWFLFLTIDIFQNCNASEGHITAKNFAQAKEELKLHDVSVM